MVAAAVAAADYSLPMAAEVVEVDYTPAAAAEVAVVDYTLPMAVADYIPAAVVAAVEQSLPYRFRCPDYIVWYSS
jgi:hypothetical protein